MRTPEQVRKEIEEGEKQWQSIMHGMRDDFRRARVRRDRVFALQMAGIALGYALFMGAIKWLELYLQKP